MRVGSYQLYEALGRGASGRVFRARNAAGDDVAVKIFGPGAALDAPARARFDQEVEHLARARHPALTELLDHGVDDTNGPYIVTRLVRGRTLRDVARQGPLSPEAAIALLAPVADAVAVLHGAGLVHRDLKPENVLVTDAGEVVLVDLGIALGAGATRHTATGAVTGSVPYMAPEQIEAGEITAATDVWALAVVLYELVVGERPFSRAREGEEVAAILGGRHEPLDVRDRRVSPELARLVETCLARETSRRPADAGALVGLLAALVPAATCAERAALLADRTTWEQRAAERRAGALRGRAERLLREGDPFGSLRALDGALASVPDDRATLALVERATSVAARQRTPAATPPRGVGVAAVAGIAAAVSAVVIAIGIFGGDAPSEPARPGTPVVAPPAADAGTRAAASRPANAGPSVPGLRPLPPSSFPTGSSARDPEARRVLAALDAAVRAAPRDARPLVRRAGRLAADGRLRDANRDLLTALRLDSRNVQALIGLARLYGRVGQSARARPLLDRAVRLAPNDPAAWTDLSLALTEPIAALAAADRAVALAPRSGPAQRRRCSLVVRLVRADAAAVCTVAVKLSPGDPWVLADRAVAFSRVGDHGRALADADRAVALRPEEAALHLQQARLRDLAGLNAAARSSRAEACRLGATEACE